VTNLGGFDPAFASSMREMSRGHIADIWRRGSKGETLGREDAAFFKAMQDHPEYTDFWEHAAELASRDIQADRTNPFLHISLHAVLERQIAEANPPETAQALFRLTRAGMDRHEALHRIASLLTEMLWESMHAGKRADPETFRKRLRGLKP
jgi:hypothetical protein